VDLREFCPSSAPIDGPLRALFSGRLVRQKRVPYLLEAVRDIPVDVDLVGAGPDEEALREQAIAVGVQDRVRFLGWASREDMPQRYRDAGVFVFPSVEEGMPNVVLEAMASGLPIIATDIYGHRGLVRDGDNGFLVPVEDSKAIAGALQRLAFDPKLREQMGERSRKRAEAFGWRRTAETYLRLSELALA
jgi:glycosyltransferase involved in cell wall biosynthesis